VVVFELEHTMSAADGAKGLPLEEVEDFILKATPHSYCRG